MDLPTLQCRNSIWEKKMCLHGMEAWVWPSQNVWWVTYEEDSGKEEESLRPSKAA
jgi:hypothetical protein